MSKRIQETVEQITIGTSSDIKFEISKWSWVGMNAEPFGVEGVEFWRIDAPPIGIISFRVIGDKVTAFRGWGNEDQENQSQAEIQG